MLRKSVWFVLSAGIMLTALIRNGVAGTAMAPSAYNDAELSALVAYLRNMGTVNLADVKKHLEEFPEGAL